MLINKGTFYKNGKTVSESEAGISQEEARKNTLAYGILSAHNRSGDDANLKIRFDALASHDITYVGIIQTARASKLKEFPVPYVLTNCHNSLCAVGGTINEDDHAFGLSAAKKYGGIFVPPHLAVIHSFMRENFAACGNMILGSDSHTRYGAIGCMAIGEGGPELVKQLLSRTYDIKYPEIVCVHLTGKPMPGVGPQDVALTIIGEVFKSGAVKNKVLEFVGDGIASLNMDYRCGIDVMSTETTCLSTIWETDDQTARYLALHGRADAYRELKVTKPAYYDSLIDLDLSKVRPMIALPFHPSNVYTIAEFKANAKELLREVEKTAVEQLGIKDGALRLTDKVVDGKVTVDQGVIAGCAGGTFDNVCAAADILEGCSTGNGDFALSVYPASQPTLIELTKNGVAATLLEAGAVLRSAFCGPCFGAGDVPKNSGLSIRHSTRNFPNREGSKPADGQSACVALMDSRSIAATARNRGVLTAADEIEVDYKQRDYKYDDAVYKRRVYNGYGKADPEHELVFGPNISSWPEMQTLGQDLLLKVASVINDPVTTTDELIPSGDTSSYRSNPHKLATFTLSRKDPLYVATAKSALDTLPEAQAAALKTLSGLDENDPSIQRGSMIFAKKPGDGSAREQAASCQKVLGGLANVANEYATKRYRSNLINWGILPFTMDGEFTGERGDLLYIPGIRCAVEAKEEKIAAHIITKNGEVKNITLTLSGLSDEDRQIILDGCLINYYSMH